MELNQETQQDDLSMVGIIIGQLLSIAFVVVSVLAFVAYTAITQ